MSNELTTLVLNAEVSKERLANLTRDLSRDLTRSGVPATVVEGHSARGTRGDVVSLGQLALDLVTTEAVTALIECLKAYMSRERTLIVKVRRHDGGEVEVSAKNVNDTGVAQALSVATSRG
jgi:hypothetical protein